jgi:GDP-L-fucose synthase
LVAHAVGFGGRIRFDPSRPDGAPRKLLDCRRLLGTGWRPTIDLETGLRLTVADYLARFAGPAAPLR